MKFRSDIVIGLEKTIFFLIIIILFTTIIYALKIYHCDNIEGLEGLCFDITFAVTTDKEMKIPSKYNFPHFVRAGDYLYIKNIKIYNTNKNKHSRDGKFTLQIRPIDYIDKPYTDLKEIYPENYGEFSFDVKQLLPKYHCEYTFNADGYYNTNCDEYRISFDRYNVELFKEGEWVIVDDFQPTNKSLGSWGHTSIFNGRWKGNTFRVTSGFEMDNFKDLKVSLMLIFITLIVMISFGLFQFYLGFKSLRKKEQKENRFLFWMHLVCIVAFIVLIIYVLRTNFI